MHTARLDPNHLHQHRQGTGGETEGAQFKHTSNPMQRHGHTKATTTQHWQRHWHTIQKRATRTEQPLVMIQLECTLLWRTRREERQHCATRFGFMHGSAVELRTGKRMGHTTHLVPLPHVATALGSGHGVAKQLVRILFKCNVQVVPINVVPRHVVEMLVLMIVLDAILVPCQGRCTTEKHRVKSKGCVWREKGEGAGRKVRGRGVLLSPCRRQYTVCASPDWYKAKR